MPETFAPSMRAPRERFNPGVRLPISLNIAFWMLIASAALRTVSILVKLILISGIGYVAYMHAQESANHLRPLPDSTIIGGLVFDVVAISLFAAADVVLAILVRQGRNWARVIVTILCGLSVLSFLQGFEAVRWILATASAVVVVLLWLRPSNRFMQTVKVQRLAYRSRQL